MSNIKERWDTAQEKIHKISVRERVMVTSCICVLIVGVFELLMWEPMRIEKKNIQEKRKVYIKNQVEYTNEQRNYMRLKNLPKIKEKEINEYNTAIRLISEKIENSARAMVSPQKMTRRLRKILSQTGGMKLMSLKNFEGKPLVIKVLDEDDVAATEKKVKEVELDLFKHGVEIKLEGTFDSAEKFIVALNMHKNSFYWELLEYEVKNYPRGILTIKLHSISRYKEWVGA